MDWWLEHGLDGVVGGALGGVVTGFAVWLTLRHESQRAREQDSRRSVVELHRSAVRFAHTDLGDGTDALRDRLLEMSELADAVAWLCADELGLRMTSGTSWLAAVAQSPELKEDNLPTLYARIESIASETSWWLREGSRSHARIFMKFAANPFDQVHPLLEVEDEEGSE